MSDDSISEIYFWANNVDSLNGRVYWGCNKLCLSSPTMNWFFIRIGSLRKKCRVLFENVVCLALEAFPGRLSSSRVIWYSDNWNVESFLLNGSRKLDLQAFQICISIAFLLMLDGSLGILMSEPTPSAILLILTIMLLMILLFRVFMITGDCIM